MKLRGICLTGVTGCGKTELALALAATYPLEIVSMDSAMVYRGMDIGTAKPARRVLRRWPHHLVDVREPEDAYSAGDFRTDAGAAMADIASRGKWPLLVGGTLLYLRALRDGLADLPQRDETVRAALEAEAAESGWPALHARLRALDPVAAETIKPSDRQRIQRALEVHIVTGRTLSELKRSRAQVAGPDIEIAAFAVTPIDRAELGRRLAERFDAMTAAGFVTEVEHLRDRPRLTASHASMRSVGYRQLWAYVEGRYSWDEARRRAIAATRQLAKRQMTWLRSDTDIVQLPALTAETEIGIRDSVGRILEQWA
jgi:tRNA dimethylallyltransferase